MQILLVLTVVFGLSTAASAQQTFVIDKPIAGNLAIVVKHSLDQLEFNPPTQMDTQVALDQSIQTLLEYPSVVRGVTLSAGNLSEDDAYLCAAARSSTGALVSIPDGMRIPEGAPANDPLLGDAEQIRFDAWPAELCQPIRGRSVVFLPGFMSGDTINLVPPPAYKSDAWMNAWHSSLVVALYPRRFRVVAEPGKSGIERAERPSAIIRIRLRIK